MVKRKVKRGFWKKNFVKCLLIFFLVLLLVLVSLGFYSYYSEGDFASYLSESFFGKLDFREEGVGLGPGGLYEMYLERDHIGWTDLFAHGNFIHLAARSATLEAPSVNAEVRFKFLNSLKIRQY